MAVGIKRLGDAVIFDHLHQDMHVAVQVFMRGEIKAQDFPCGIIHNPVEAHFRASFLKPGEGAGIGLNKLPLLWSPFAPAKPPGFSMLKEAGYPGLFERPSDGS